MQILQTGSFNLYDRRFVIFLFSLKTQYRS